MEPQVTKKIVDRSSSYPGMTISQALEAVSKLRNSYANHPFSRGEAAKALNHEATSGTAARKVAAMTQFGLLIREGNAYRVSELAEKILFYENEESKKESIAQAVKNPKIYSALIEKFNKQSLPLLLNNILISNYGINSKVATMVAKDFALSLEFAGLLKNGVVSDVIGNDNAVEGELSSEIQPGAKNDIAKNNSIKDPIQASLSGDVQAANINLTFGRAQIILPHKMTQKDLDRVKLQIDVLALVVDE